MLRGLLVVLAVIACAVLGAVVLISHPANEVDLLAGGLLAAGAGLLFAVLPARLP